MSFVQRAFSFLQGLISDVVKRAGAITSRDEPLQLNPDEGKP
jgi:hypothetical protein